MQNFKEGEVILINKPYKWTSFDVVKKIRGLLNKHYQFTYDSSETTPKFKIKVGHAGTLDPLATGLMLICTGKQTKNIDQLQAQTKEYTGSFFLGATTPSFDKEHDIDEKFPTSHITEESIFSSAKKFIGTCLQIPPIFSAIKVDGKRLYKSARKGNIENVPMPREVHIYEFEITKTAIPLIDFRIVCSKGTYIRSIARDFGKELASGAYLESLCRTSIGNYQLEDAVEIEDFEKSLSDSK